MINRKRNVKLGLWLTQQEKQTLKKLATLKGMSVTDIIVELSLKDYEKLIQRKEE